MVIMMILGQLKQVVCSKSVILFLLIGFVFNSGFAQEISKKELKEKEKAEKKKSVLALIESETFTFKARTAITNGGKSIDLIGNPNYLQVTPDNIESSMPFFGTVTSVRNYNVGDGGLNFNSKPAEFIIEKSK